MRTRHPMIVLAVALLVLGSVSCGSDDDSPDVGVDDAEADGAPATGAAGDAEGTTPADAPAADAPAGDAPTADAPAGDATQVELVDFAIEAPDTAPTGEFAVSNTGEAPHTFTAEDGTWDTGTIQPGGESTVSITEPGTYAYLCTIHPAQMTGTIEVTSG